MSDERKLGVETFILRQLHTRGQLYMCASTLKQRPVRGECIRERALDGAHKKTVARVVGGGDRREVPEGTANCVCVAKPAPTVVVADARRQLSKTQLQI
jgi:hypothetical protein